ncbi:MAG: hypothetical protein J7494_07650 [Sphingobium sp.]|nr:hypothetical protein [Sphingobium sp.]
MRIFSKLTGGIAAAALVASAAGPAAARDWRWGSSHYHHDRGPSAGAVIGAVAAVGIIAAIASAASKKKQETEQQRRYDVDPPYDRSRDDYRYDDRSSDGDRYDDGARYDSGRDGPRYDDARSSRGDQDAAVDACVVAARSEASRNGDYAEIKGVTSVSSSSNGWAVSGSVEQRSSYRATDGWQRNFRCTWQSGRVSGLSLD